MTEGRTVQTPQVDNRELRQIKTKLLALMGEVADLREHMGLGYDFEGKYGEGRVKLMPKSRLK